MSIQALETIREVLKDTKFEGKVYLVGGYVRDSLLLQSLPKDTCPQPQYLSSIQNSDDIDLVYEGDFEELANILYESGVCEHHPIIYSRYRTAMVNVAGSKIEIVGARKESYRPDSRKPDALPATLKEDVFRRDFTINSLLENLHTGNILDITNRGLDDLRNGIIRTPLDPVTTFNDDPLRMMRAIRFAARFGFAISGDTLKGICANSYRLGIISAERIRDEFCKIVMSGDGISQDAVQQYDLMKTRPDLVDFFRSQCMQAAYGMELLRITGLLRVFIPEIDAEYKLAEYNAENSLWMRSLLTMEYLPQKYNYHARLAGLFAGFSSLETTRAILQRLKFSNHDIRTILRLIESVEMVRRCINDASDRSARMLINSIYPYLDTAICLSKAVAIADGQLSLLSEIAEFGLVLAGIIQKEGYNFTSPIDGEEIMEIIGCSEGAIIGSLKDHLLSEVLDGNIKPGDKETAKMEIRKIWKNNYDQCI